MFVLRDIILEIYESVKVEQMKPVVLLEWLLRHFNPQSVIDYLNTGEEGKLTLRAVDNRQLSDVHDLKMMRALRVMEHICKNTIPRKRCGEHVETAIINDVLDLRRYDLPGTSLLQFNTLEETVGALEMIIDDDLWLAA